MIHTRCTWRVRARGAPPGAISGAEMIDRMSENLPTGDGQQQPQQQPPTPEYAPPSHYIPPQQPVPAQPVPPQYAPPQQPPIPQAPTPQAPLYAQPQQPTAPQYAQPVFVPPSQYGYVPPTPPQKSMGIALAAMITGGIGLLFIILGVFLVPGFVLGVLLSIAALILGIIALVKKQQFGLALGGLISGALGTITSIPVALFFIFTPLFWSATHMGSPVPYDSSPYDSSPWSDQENGYFDDWYPREFCEEVHELNDLVAATPDSDETRGLETPEARAIMENLSETLTYNDWVYASFLDLTAPGTDQSFFDMEYEREYVLDAIEEDVSGCLANGF